VRRPAEAQGLTRRSQRRGYGDNDILPCACGQDSAACKDVGARQSLAESHLVPDPLLDAHELAQDSSGVPYCVGANVLEEEAKSGVVLANVPQQWDAG